MSTPAATDDQTPDTQNAAVQNDATPKKPPRRSFDMSSPYDKPDLTDKARKAYERKVVNIGLVLVVAVLALVGISAHKLIGGIGKIVSESTDFRMPLPETPFSPPPSRPVPQMHEPTRMNLPGRDLPSAEPHERQVIGQVTGIGQTADDGSRTVYVRFLVSETGQICSLSVMVPAHMQVETHDAMQAIYDPKSPAGEICMSSQIRFITE